MSFLPIPLLDLGKQHAPLADQILADVAREVADSAFVLSPKVTEFENRFAEFSGASHCVGLANGTDALELLLRAAGISRGDEVIVPANTFIATAHSVLRAGADLRIVDCDPDHFLMDTEDVLRKITPRTRAVIAVHLYGQMAPMEELIPLLEERGIALFEDCAQAHGASRLGRGVATWGVGGAFSFYPGKNLGAWGDGGAAVTNSEFMARRLRCLGNHGLTAKHRHDEVGFNSRLDSIQAIVLAAKLKFLDRWNGARAEAANRYFDLLKDVEGVQLPATLAGNKHVWHLFVVRVQRRDEVLDHLREVGIGAQVHYPVPIHLQHSLNFLGHRAADFPNAEQGAGEILSLPLFPEITAEQQQIVAEALAMATAKAPA